ncbi:neutral/alkaline non-lysosomal ceramidase N-terminal domain-containing protein [Defluviitalea phaphyphila]|uniref:neutral/alkaline non-lysosomal ceramidase N-terminal domain-containing protein n=1 Tax=Defluviitalea phaphyphila TaxID=1473580 RepID=UPI000731A4A9|nr:neutral/alkaline non-lysosomal ceramidase N-terminal domain-containing protein [Defluviitalea phaphyphila]
MKLGISKIKITPQNPVRLCGYATRTSNFEEVKEDIYIRIHAYNKDNKDILFIYGDLLWWGSDFVKNIKSDLIKKFPLEKNNIFFIASHNHSGPPTSNLFTSPLETYDKKYSEFLKQKVVEGIKKALENMEEVTGEIYYGKSNLNVFRRVIVDGKVTMAPNYDIEVDRNLTIVGLYRKDHTLKGLIIHYPCHANISNENYIQPDYPGVALRMLDEKFPSSVSIFLQGCTADIRPNFVLGNKFVSGTYKEVIKFATSFYEDCCKTLKTDPLLLDFNLKTSKKEVILYEENLKTLDEIILMLKSEVEVEREWAKKVLEKDNRNYEIMEINKIDFADKISFLTFNAEVSQYYSKFAKSLDKNIISMAYTNGMIGYICTKKQISEGGYEPEGSALYFALSGTYKPEIEEKIHNNIKKLIRGE